jgi:hypothetical protein
MPWTRKQVKFLLSGGSPLTGKQAQRVSERSESGREKEMKQEVVRQLRRRGINILEPEKQLAALVKNDAHLQKFLLATPEDHRKEAYESLKPHLSFTPMLLEELIADEDAEVPERAEFIDERKIKNLTLTCSKCTQQGFFQAITRQEATDQAAYQGWKQRGERTVCPKCPA